MTTSPTHGQFDFSPTAKAWVLVLTGLGTLFCIAVSFLVDSYSFRTGEWGWGNRPINNLILPLMLAAPFFYFLLSKLRELAIAHKNLMVVATTDGLTSLLNRAAFTTLVEAYLERVEHRKSDRSGALLVIDVDHFKTVNDRFGHASGDEALKVVARAIKDNVRDLDLVGRLGGEEFGVFLPGVDSNRAASVAERIRVAINKAKFVPQGEPTRLSASVGGVAFDHGESFSDLFRRADRHLYVAKNNGRNRVEVHPVRGLDGTIAIH